MPADQLESLSRTELIARLRYLTAANTSNSNGRTSSASNSRDEKPNLGGGVHEFLKRSQAGCSSDEKVDKIQAEAHRRESILVMRLAAKEQEVHDYFVSQIFFNWV